MAGPLSHRVLRAGALWLRMSTGAASPGTNLPPEQEPVSPSTAGGTTVSPGRPLETRSARPSGSWERRAQGDRQPARPSRVEQECPFLGPGDEAEMSRHVADHEALIAIGAAGIRQDQGVIEGPGGTDQFV